MLRRVFCVCLAWAAAASASAPATAAEKDAAAAVESLGGRLTRNAAGDVVGVDLSNAWLTDADLARLADLPRLERISLAYTKVTDLGLEHLAPLRRVKVLDLYYAEYVTDL